MMICQHGLAPDEPVILVVDDDDDCRALIRDAIETSGGSYRVFECRDGVEGLEFLRQCDEFQNAPRPTVVFLDLEMPGKGGQDVLAELRADPELRHLPVIVFTGLDDDEQERLALANGANSYTCKGDDPNRLFEIVADAAEYWTRVHRPIAVAG